MKALNIIFSLHILWNSSLWLGRRDCGARGTMCCMSFSCWTLPTSNSSSCTDLMWLHIYWAYFLLLSRGLPSCCLEGKMMLLLEAPPDLQPLSLSFLQKLKKTKPIFFLFCLLLPLHFSHLHAEPWLKTLRVETQEVGEKKLIWESSDWINGAKEQAEVAQLWVRKPLLNVLCQGLVPGDYLQRCIRQMLFQS